MNSATTQFVPSRRMGICEPIHQMEMWADEFLADSSPMLLEVDANKLENQSSDASHATAGPLNTYDQEASKPNEKILRRQAQNRVAARKSRQRKKAYVQQLENSRLKLLQLEQELERIRQQGLHKGKATDDCGLLGSSRTLNPGIATFEMEYAHWIEIHDRQISKLRDSLQTHTEDAELKELVQNAMKHYLELFAMKAKAAKADVFYIISGMWRTPAERFFLWIGGFRPSELLKVLMPYLDTLSESQCQNVGNLTQSCQQLEDALSQGMDKLHYILADAVADGKLGEGNYLPQLGSAMEKFEALVRFVVQADHLRQVTLTQMSEILTTRQTARALLALGEYMKRLRVLSSCCSSHPRQQT